MKVLVACEFSGVVRDAFIAAGHDAWSCDLLPASGNHLQGDCLQFLNQGWDLMIAHPPCTYLSCSSLHWNHREPGRPEKTLEALEFVRKLMAAPIPKIAIENPAGRIGTAIKKASQYIQPYQYGHDASKKTGLWLKNLPPLEPTDYVKPRWVCNKCKTARLNFAVDFCQCGAQPDDCKPRWGNQTDSGQNKLPPSKDRWAKRSETYAGIAKAMAEQWGK